MYGQLEPLLIVPRFSTYVGAADFDTAPLEVAMFSRIILTFWMGRISAGGALSARFQDSHDARQWTDLGTSWGSTGTTIRREDLRRRYLRMRITLTGTDPAVTCWAAGAVEHRVE